MESLFKFLDRIGGLNQEDFLKEITTPYLVSNLPSPNRLELYDPDRYPSKQHGFKTTCPGQEEMEMEWAWLEQGWAAPLPLKGDAPRQIVNIGRTSNNDIVIPFPSISKFQACLILYPEEEKAFVIDGDSTNGTFLNTEKLTPSEKYPLKNGDVLRFGFIIEFKFYFPSALYGIRF